MAGNLSPVRGAMTLSITTLSITTLSIKTLSITTFSIQGLFATPNINNTQHNNTLIRCHYAECCVSFIDMLNVVVVLSVIILIDVAPHTFNGPYCFFSRGERYGCKIFMKSATGQLQLPP